MRKIPALIAVLGLTALTLTGCAVGQPDCTRPAEPGTAVTSLVSVTGPRDSAPTVAVTTPINVTSASAWDLQAGSGTPVTDPSQLVVVDVVLYDGSTGKKIIATPFDGDLSRVFTMAEWQQTFPHFDALLRCAQAGSRIALALPPDGIAKEAKPGLGIGENDSTIAVVDLQKVYLPRATGSLVFNDAHGMPTVVRAASGQPGIIVPDATAPSQIVVQTLIRGDGATLSADDTARVHYTGVPWEQGATVFDSSWGSKPVSVKVSGTDRPGFAEALKGQTVGSQVLVVVPADKVPKSVSVPVMSGKTLVFVIDILGIDAPAKATTR